MWLLGDNSVSSTNTPTVGALLAAVVVIVALVVDLDGLGLPLFVVEEAVVVVAGVVVEAEGVEGVPTAEDAVAPRANVTCLRALPATPGLRLLLLPPRLLTVSSTDVITAFSLSEPLLLLG